MGQIIPSIHARHVLWIKQKGLEASACLFHSSEARACSPAPPWLPGDLQVTPVPALALTVSSRPPPTPGSKLPTTPQGQRGWSRIWTGGLDKASLSCWAGWHPPVLSPEEVALWDYCLSVETWGRGQSAPRGRGQSVQAHTPAHFWSARFSCLSPSPKWRTHLPGFVLSPRACC